MTVKPVEAFRLTLAELGDAPDLQLATAIEQKFGIKIHPRYIPLYRAIARNPEPQNPKLQVSHACPVPECPPQSA
jgi:hypothetical protein